MSEATKAEMREAAAGLRRLLDAVDDGRLGAPTPREIAMIRRVEGAVIALEAVARDPKTTHLFVE